MPPPPEETILADDASPGLFGFFRDVGVRETIESVIVAIVLALMFRAYEAEAFIIPTGSMAPSLNGQHIDLECENCHFRYHAGASDEATKQDSSLRVTNTFCPICQFNTKLRRGEGGTPEHESNSGDRILVNKFIYDFSEPQRYDVIVFKNPNNGKQNYIKRLIGLPGDNILIENGDIYQMFPADDGWTKEITRKPARKLRHTLQTMDDTHHIGRRLEKVNWPSRWQAFTGGPAWEMGKQADHPTFASDGGTESWLRYRHFQPRKYEWSAIENGILPKRFQNNLPPGELITDQYGYNGSIQRRQLVGGVPNPEDYSNSGMQWVGDIGLECWIDVKSDSGEIAFDIVEGGAHFTCSIDVATGKATLVVDDSQVDTKVTFTDGSGNQVAQPTANTNLQGAGSYHVEYVNADDQIHMWINNRYVAFDVATYNRVGIPVPTYSATDPGDAEPLGVGTDGAEVEITRLKVVRDIYYTSVKGVGNPSLENETTQDPEQILIHHRTPTLWSSPLGNRIYTEMKRHDRPMFELVDDEDDSKDQFLPMGDNSPRSLDGRVWSGPNFVHRDLLIGRALFVYWPHTLHEPIELFPNFGEMGFIR